MQFLIQVPQSGNPHPKISSSNDQVDYKISDKIQDFTPYWGPPEVAKIKGQGPWWEDGETPFLWVPLPWAHIILQPSIPACKMKEGEGKGLNWMSSFQCEVLQLYLSLSSFPLASLDGQELTKSLKSPKEDEQFYAAQVRSGKGQGT